MFWKIPEKTLRATIRDEVSRSIEAHLEKAIENGVINALKSFGADMDNKHEVQKDFHYLRHLRKHSEESGRSLIRAIISVIIAASAVALWEGIRIIIRP